MSLESSPPTRYLLSWGIFFQRLSRSGTLFSCMLAVLLVGPSQTSAHAQSPQALNKDAEAAYERGDIQQAIHSYEELLKFQPDSVEVRTNLGVALARSGRYSDAVTQYEEALHLSPDNPIVRLNLALAWYKLASFDKAATELEHLRAKHADNRQSLYLLADCYLRLGRNGDAVTLLQPFYDASPEDHTVDFALGMALIRNRQIQKGEVIIDQVLKVGTHGEVDLLMGAARLAAGDSKNAALTIHKALEADATLPLGWSLYGRALLDSEDRQGAIVSFQKALQDDPNDFDANLYLGGVLRHDGDTTAAAPYLEKALRLRPASLEARFQVGMVNLALGRLEEARRDLEQVEQTSPDFQEVHVQLAALYARLHLIDDRKREQEIVLKLNEKAREKGPQPRP